MLETRILKIDPSVPDEARLKEAAYTLRNGGLVIIPTETVYGIAANMLNARAVARLHEIKNRPKEKPFSLHISSKNAVEEFAADIPVRAYRLMDKFWPGPLTVVLRAKDGATIGMRMPDHRVAAKIIDYSEVPVVCPSANLSGSPAPANFQEAMKDLRGMVDLAVDCGPTSLQGESTVVDLTVEPYRILRQGILSKDAIEKAVRSKTVLMVCTGNSCRSVMAQALLEKELKQAGRDDVTVVSCGTMMMEGLPATYETRELLRREGMDVSAHVSKRINAGLVKRADIILVMEQAHEDKVLELFPEAKKKVFLLKEFARINTNNLAIEDPIGRSLEFYEKTLAVIKEAVQRIAQII